MKLRAIALTVVVLLVGVGLCYAADMNPNMGTWKLNEAKSKLVPGMAKNNTVVYAADGANIKVTVDGTDADGKPFHSEWTGKFDGKNYAVTGDSTTDMRSYKMINAHTYDLTNKKGGKVVSTGHLVVAADGMSRTLTVHASDAKGAKITSVGVYDKQM